MWNEDSMKECGMRNGAEMGTVALPIGDCPRERAGGHEKFKMWNEECEMRNCGVLI
jgi:hypothetical protein